MSQGNGAQKAVLVTGAARGIGLATARRFLDDGWRVALLDIDGRRVFAQMDEAARGDEAPEQVLAGHRVKLLVKGDGDTYFQIPQSRSLDISRVVQAIRRRVGA